MEERAANEEQRNNWDIRSFLHSLRGYSPFPRPSLLGALTGSAAVMTATSGITAVLVAVGVIGLPPGPTFELEGFSNWVVSEALPPDNLASAGDSLRLCTPQNLYVWVRADGMQPPVIFNGRLVPHSAPDQVRQIPYQQELPTALMWWKFEQPLPPDEYTFELIQLGKGALGSWEVTINC